MVTEEEYLKAKAIVEEYEDQEYRQATIEAMYCVECQAFDEHDCFCDSDSLSFGKESMQDECDNCDGGGRNGIYGCSCGGR